MLNSILLFISELPWAEAGLAGMAFITLATMLWRIIKLVQHKSSTTVDIEFIKAFNKEMLEQIEAREQRLVDLQEKTLEALTKNAIALEILVDRIKNDKQNSQDN